MEPIKDLNEIDRTTKEGRLLFAALAKITTESQTDKTPYEVLEQLEDLATKIDKEQEPKQIEKPGHDANNAVSGRLSQMQSFFLDAINKSGEECNACYLADLYYESIGKRRYAASRDSFGQTSAAYRTCRRLASLDLIKEIHYKTSSGYSYTMYAALH